MLLKHPDQYSLEELEAWVRQLVDGEVSEGPRLDYKQTISLESREQRLEAAKDISSFANEIGGTIIYGIPEDKKSDEIAIPLKPYGIDPTPDLESRLENIYIDSIAPRLPEWRIRKVNLTEYPGKVVYVAWVPESWIGVHMVEAYKEQKYYRRGQLRAVAMAEHEVRQRYERLRIGQSALENFLNSPELNYLSAHMPNNKFVSHYVVCPTMLFADRVNFATPHMREWLRENRYKLWGWSGEWTYDEWTPFSYGVKAKELPDEPWMVELHKNGAISHWSETVVRQDQDNRDQGKYKLQYLSELKAFEGFLQFARSLYQKIQYFGPLYFQVVIENRPHVPLYLYSYRFGDLTDRSFIGGDMNLFIYLSEPSSKLFETPNEILKAIADEMFRAFGVWDADCFDDQVNLKKP